MKNSRIAQTLRSLSLKPALESESDVITGDGEQVQTVAIAAVDETPAAGADAPAEDKDLSTTQVEEDKGPKEEAAETVVTDSPVVASTESEAETPNEIAADPSAEQAAAAAESSAVTGDGEQTEVVKIDAIDETPADGAGAPGEDAEVTAKVEEVGERSELETAETEVTDSQDLAVSQEGFKGAVKGFAIGTAGVLLSPLTLGLSNGAVDAGLKQRRERLGNEINVLAKRLADLKNGDVAQAKKEGIQVPKEQINDVDAGEVVKSFILGMVLPFYSTYQGHKVEELEIQLAAKVAELKIEMAKHGVSAEGLDDGEAAVAAAAAFAEGAAGAAEAAAAAAGPEAPAADSVEEVIEVAADAAAEEAVDAAADGAVEAVEEVAGEEAAEVVEETIEDAAGEITDVVAESVESELDNNEEAIAESAEIEELDDATAEGEQQVEEYEQAAATLESLVEALQEAQQNGGLTRQAAQFYQIGFESVGVRLTGRPFQNAHGEAAMPSLESFGGTMRRDQATTVSMESAKEWLAKVWEVIKKTFAQIKAWLIKFFQLVMDKGERIRARALKVKAAADKVGTDKPKAAQIKFAGAAKIAVGGKVSTGDLNELVAFAKEAGDRNSEASRAIIQMRLDLRNMIQSVQSGVKLTETTAASGDVALKGELRSAVFSQPYKGEEGEGFKTKLLPGNVEFLAINPLSGDFSIKGIAAVVARGWKVVELRDDAVTFENDLPVLTAFHIKEIADAAIRVVDAAKAAKAELKEEALSLADLTFPDDMDQSDARAIKSLAWMTGKILQMQSSSIGKVLKYCVGTSDAYLDYAVASLKQYGAEAPAEAAAPAVAAA